MSNKQKCLLLADSKIAQWQKAKEAIYAIPDEVFDVIFETGVFAELTKEEKVPLVSPSPKDLQNLGKSSPLKATDDEYGKNQKTLLKAFETYKRPLTKSEIVRFFENEGYVDPYDTVTNAIVYLKNSSKLKGFKPHGVKFRGLLWTLMKWWESGVLKQEFSTLPPSLTE